MNELGPVRFFAMLSFGAAIGLTAVIWWYFSFDVVLAWLIAITLVSFLTFGYDKAISGSKRTRVPEKVLLALTLAGGTIGTFAGRAIFRHKTIKMSFQNKLWFVVVVQIILVVVYFLWAWG